MNPIDDAIAIWKAGVAAVDPRRLVIEAVSSWRPFLQEAILKAKTIRVVGAGKAAAAMAVGLEEALDSHIDKLTGLVNVVKGCSEQTRKTILHPARPAGSNFPTETGVVGSNAMLKLLAEAEPDDLAICLLSGGGSALMPAPVEGVSLADKIAVTKLLQDKGATIEEVNSVRTHLSRIKGGQLANAFRGQWLVSLIISDVIGDRLNVIASGPTADDRTDFCWPRFIIDKYALRDRAPASVVDHLDNFNLDVYLATKLGTLNQIIGSNAIALQTVECEASRIGNATKSLGSEVSGEASEAASRLCEVVQKTHQRPAAILFGGETTVMLGPNPGKGGRNQEFVLAMLCELGLEGMKGVTILCAGTDGEDGPTDAAGAIGTEETLRRAKALNLDPQSFLDRHDSYHFFEATGGLFKTGLTGTNVMDLGVILLS